MKIALPPVISLTGVGQVGKTEIARYLKDRYGYGGDHINEPMVAMAIPLLERMGCSNADAISRLTTSRKAESIPGYEWLTGRKVLQAIGYNLRNALGRLTDGDNVDQSFYLDMWERRHADFDRLVNESARYPVEIEWSEDRGGIVIGVDAANSAPANDHVSEVMLPHDYALFNDFDGLPRLYAKVDAVLVQWGDPSNVVYELPERRLMRLLSDEPGICFTVDGEVRYGGGREAFEQLEGEMATTLLQRTRDRFPDHLGKAAEMEKWLAEHRDLQRNRAAAVIAHFGVAEFESRYSALKAISREKIMNQDANTVESSPGLLDDAIVVRVVRPTSMTIPADHIDQVPIVQAEKTADGTGWKSQWCFSGKPWTTVPAVHPTREDAMTDAHRRAMASIDPEAQGDEFEDGAEADPFDQTIHYGSLLIDDENRYRGRWYRGQWEGEGAYTDLLYETPGQARRAARRLRTTGDES